MSKEIERKYFDYNAIEDRVIRALLRKKATEGKAILKRTAKGIWQMGELLTIIKDVLPHGQFGQWIDAEFGLTDRSAQHFMAVHQRFKSEIISDLNASPTVLYLLAAPSVPEETRNGFVERMKAGDHVTVADVKAHTAAPATPQPSPLQGTGYDDAEEEVAAEGPQEPRINGYGAPIGHIEPDGSLTSYSDTDAAEPQQPESPAAPPIAPAEDELPDTEWLMRCPSYRHLMKFPHAGREFKAMALFWREMKKKAIGQFKHAVDAHAPKHMEGPLVALWRKAATVPHPETWPLCVKCRGSLVVKADTGDHTGHGADIECPNCTGGYTL